MTVPAPLRLPDPDGYRAWLDERRTSSLAEVRSGADRLRGMRGAAVDSVLAAWNDIGVALGNVLSVSSVMANVHPDEVVRSAAEDAEREARGLLTELSLDRGLFEVLAAADPDGLDAGATRMLERSLRDFRRGGVDRDERTRSRLRTLSERETELSQRFGKNIRDSVTRFRVAAERLVGLPADFVEAHEVADDGTVELTTEYPDYVPVMTFALDRSLREQMLRAFLDRAWPQNDAVLAELLAARREHAQLLDFPDWPTYDAEVKMISTGDAIAEFLERITALAEEPARRDFDVLLQRARQDLAGVQSLGAVDKAFYSEAVRRESLQVDAQEVRRYFDFGKVRAGLLDVTGRLFGVQYAEVPDAPLWHDEVAAYDVLDDEGVLGRIYLDLHPREGKYSHAALFDLVTGVAGRQLPEGVLVCNFPRGLMEHNQVVTLFHEFGHLLHHVLAGRQQWVRFSGVATEWDFVEAPSQLLEEWARDHSVLATFATDEEGKVIPSQLVDRMRTADEFGKGFHVRTQMFYASISYRFHREAPEHLTATVEELQRRYDLFDYLPGTHFHASFGHLGGYSSAYYTYMWSLVIAKDLFSAFDRSDLFAPDAALRYRDRVLAAGGSKDAAQLVADFLGRPYDVAAFEAWLAG